MEKLTEKKSQGFDAVVESLKNEKLIQKVQDYFIKAITAKRYEITNVFPHYFVIRIDGKYVFQIWIGSIGEFRHVSTFGDNFMVLPPFPDKLKIELFSRFEGLNVERKVARINSLRSELEQLERASDV